MNGGLGKSHDPRRSRAAPGRIMKVFQLGTCHLLRQEHQFWLLVGRDSLVKDDGIIGLPNIGFGDIHDGRRRRVPQVGKIGLLKSWQGVD